MRFSSLENEVQQLKNIQESQIGGLRSEWTRWSEAESKVKEMIEENMKQKFEFFAKNINEIYSLMESLKKKVKNKNQSKNNDVIFARLNGYAKNIKSLNDLYRKIKDVNMFCKQTVISVSAYLRN